MKDVVIVGEKPKVTEKVEPQTEVRELIKGPGTFEETVKLIGEVPDGKYFHTKVVIHTRDATPEEIAAFLAV